MAIDIIDVLLARAGGSSGGGGGGDTSNAVTEVTVENADTAAAKIKKTKVRKNAITKAYEVMKNYVSKGQNEDGSMTQKAITDELDLLTTNVNNALNGLDVVDRHAYSIAARVDNIEQRIDDIVAGEVNLGAENAGKIVLVGDDGGLVPGSLTEQDIIEGGGVTPPPPPPPEEPEPVLGLEIDYTNRTFVRLEDSADLTAGADFDQFPMFGGRMRCTLYENGLINAFYNDTGYSEGGRDGEVMVYQPKFYYKREPIEFKTDGVLSKERLYISYGEQEGYKVHPLFINEDGEEVDYILFSAYENTAYGDQTGYSTMDADWVNPETEMLASIPAVKPISGAKINFTHINAERMAQNRGAHWHITNLRFESAEDMLLMIEFGQLNMQNAFEWGATTLKSYTGINCALFTGSTSNLGSVTGYAESSNQEIEGYNTYEYTAERQRAISYRGMENPWGNMWRMVGGALMIGDGTQKGGVPYVCADYNYDPTNLDNYISAGFETNVTANGGWISNMGYGNEDLDWLYFPARTGLDSANSALPVGDYFWGVSGRFNGIRELAVGGRWDSKNEAGPFDYAFDIGYETPICGQNARAMFIPPKDATYEANVQKWKNKMGV